MASAAKNVVGPALRIVAITRSAAPRTSNPRRMNPATMSTATATIASFTSGSFFFGATEFSDNIARACLAVLSTVKPDAADYEYSLPSLIIIFFAIAHLNTPINNNETEAPCFLDREYFADIEYLHVRFAIHVPTQLDRGSDWIRVEHIAFTRFAHYFTPAAHIFTKLRFRIVDIG
jgi:hypothetical protein